MGLDELKFMINGGRPCVPHNLIACVECAVMTQPQKVAGKELVGPLDLRNETYREYEFPDGLGPGMRTVYRIDQPVALYYRVGGSTHRVVDDKGVTHCVPAPGYRGCVLRWLSPSTPVSF